MQRETTTVAEPALRGPALPAGEPPAALVVLVFGGWNVAFVRPLQLGVLLLQPLQRFSSADSSVVVPGRVPASIWSWRI